MRVLMAVAAAVTPFLSSGLCAAQTWGQPPPTSQPSPTVEPQPAPQPGTGAPGLEAGGLRPPGSQPEPTAPAPGPTEQALAKADREDSGRGLEFFWVAGEGGVTYVGLQTLHADGLLDETTHDPVQVGPVVGGGLGLRLVFLTFGAKFRYGLFSAWDLWTLNAEAGLRIPIGSVEPYVTLGGGYASVVGVRAGPTGGREAVSIGGLDVRAGGGLDWYLSSAFSLGANLSADFLFLSRSALSPSLQSANSVYESDGSGVGAGVTLSAVAGLHF